MIEILSPNDRLSTLLDRFEALSGVGVKHLWLIDPEHRRISRYEDGSLLRQEALEMREVRLSPKDIFG